MKTTDSTPCIHVPGKPGIIDYIREDGLSGIRGETLEQVRARYPGAQTTTLGEASKKSEAMFRHPPTRITRDRFIEMLEVLPPEDWVQLPGESSFKMCEYQYGRITAIFAKIGTAYYELADNNTLTHDQIIEMCRKA